MICIEAKKKYVYLNHEKNYRKGGKFYKSLFLIIVNYNYVSV